MSSCRGALPRRRQIFARREKDLPRLLPVGLLRTILPSAALLRSALLLEGNGRQPNEEPDLGPQFAHFERRNEIAEPGTTR